MVAEKKTLAYHSVKTNCKYIDSIVTYTHTLQKPESLSAKHVFLISAKIEWNRWPIITQTLLRLSLSQVESVLRAIFCYTLDKTQGRLKEKLRKQWLMAVNHFSTSQSWISLSMKQVFNGTRSSEYLISIRAVTV